eukprot:gnl/TRDRNA2_/TRDRNA2_127009_c2_seq2.p1 gnl/TRDRNA2_/TRDRNA2_127009_c2~~gnl/TRDRNA2_/TRDRNA2_127009_c2_seq2.p1  ORF type:complete len:350 (+),score=50.88 gnl/TRDRNA2_/TRDRNA2_127009_c2_seq2:68-1117(+)
MEVVRTALLTGHRSTVSSVCAAPTGDIALSSSEDGALRLWDLRSRPCRSVRAILTGKGSGTAAEDGSEVALGCCAFLASGDPTRGILVAAGAELLLFDLRSSDRVLFNGPPTARAATSEDVNDFAVSPDGSMIAAPTDAGDTELLSTADLSSIRTLKAGHRNIAGAARFLAGGSELFTGGFDERILLWDPSTGKLRAKLEARKIFPPDDANPAQILNPPFVLGLAVSPSDQLAVALGDGSLIALPAERKPLRTDAIWRARYGHSAAVDAVAWLGRSAEAVLASVGRDCMMRLWSVPAKGKRRGGDDEEAPQAMLAVQLREKPNALAGCGIDGLLLADTSSDISVFQVRG